MVSSRFFVFLYDDPFFPLMMNDKNDEFMCVTDDDDDTCMNNGTTAIMITIIITTTTCDYSFFCFNSIQSMRSQIELQSRNLSSSVLGNAASMRFTSPRALLFTLPSIFDFCSYFHAIFVACA